MSSKHLEYSEQSIYDFFVTNMKEYPGFVALDYFGRKISYKELITNVDIVANSLVHLGVKQGDVVSVCLPNIPEAVYLFYAINKIGAISSMIHPMSAINELIDYFTMSNTKFVFGLDLISKNLRSAIEKSSIDKVVILSVDLSMPLITKTGYKIKSRKNYRYDEAISWKEFIKHGKGVIAPSCRIDCNDCAVILYSGGTTGYSKGIKLSNYSFNACARESFDACGTLYKGMKVLSILPIFHGFGLGVCIHTALNFGARCIILPNFKASSFHKLLSKYKPNLIAGVPAIFESLLTNLTPNRNDLSYLECIISGGDSLSVTTKERLDKLLKSCNCNAKVREGYGLTECVTGTCLMPNESDKVGSIGLPYADTYYKIVDPQSSEELPSGEIGEIILRGPTVMLGYLNCENENSKVLREREDGHMWLHTGDLGYIDTDGFIYFKQRIKRMIVSGGYNIYPQIIENVINSHDEVIISAVVGIPDQIMGQICKAFIILKDNHSNTDDVINEIRKLCKTNIARYALPREYIIISDLPRTKVGKIAYNELIEKYSK